MTGDSIVKARPAFPPIAGVLACCALGVLIGVSPVWAAGGSLIAIVIVVVFRVPVAACYLLALVFFLGDRLVGLGLLPHATIWVQDLVIGTLVLRVLISSAAIRRLTSPGVRTLNVALLCLFAVLLVSSLANGLGFVATIVGLRYYMRLPLAFVCLLALGANSSQFMRFLRVVVIVALLQVPLTVLQFVAAGGITGDSNSGSLNLQGGQELLFISLTCAAFLIAIGVFGFLRLQWAVLLSVALLLPPLLAGVRAVIVMAPIFLAATLVFAISRSVRPERRAAVVWAAVLTVGLVMLVASSSQVSSALGQNWVASPETVFSYENQSNAAGTGRIAALKFAYRDISTSSSTLTLGNGPGTTGQSLLAYGRLRSDLAYDTNRSQITMSLLEVGVVGVAAMVMTLGVLILSVARARQQASGLLLPLAAVVVPVICLYGAMLAYFPVWVNPAASLTLWAFVAPLLAESTRRSEVATRSSRE